MTQKFFKQVACISCTHTHIHAHPNALVCIWTHPFTYMCTHVYTHIFTVYIHTHACSNVRMCECMRLHSCYMHMWARTITCVHTYIYICISHIHSNVHGYTAAFRKAPRAPQTGGCLRQLAPLSLVSEGAQRRKGRGVWGLPPDPGPAGLRPRDVEVSRSFVLAPLGSTPSGHAVSIARPLLRNSFHSTSLLDLHNLLVTKLNHFLMARKE